METRDFLLQHPLFSKLETSEHADLLDIARIVKVPAGSYVFRKGDEGNAMYGVLSGRVGIQIQSSTGEVQTVNHLVEGELFGEIAIIDGENRTASAIAATDIRLVVIRRADFWRQVDRHPRILVPMLHFLSARARWLNAQVEEAAFMSTEQRLARRLVQLSDAHTAKQDGVRMKEIPTSQTDLGQLVGLTRESVNKILSRWKNEKIIEIGRGRITVLNWAALKAL